MSIETTPPEAVRGPYFDELSVGMVFNDAPAVTLTDGAQSTHRAIVGNRLHLSLNKTLAEAVTGQSSVASPALVWDTSIGQSTTITQHVKANLFYRGLRFHRFPAIGDTLFTETTIDGLKENSRKPGRASTGLAALHIVTKDQEGRLVLDYWRCAMLPLSSEDAPVGPRDDLSTIGQSDEPIDFGAAVRDWDLAAFRDRVPGRHFDSLSVGQSWQVQGPDVVSNAPELARLTGNIAAVHHDEVAAGGARLVYGGHTIGLAFHQVSRALPTLVTVAGWQGCDHIGPVHENDRLTTLVSIEGLDALPGGGGLAHVRALVDAAKANGDSMPVLDWRFTAVLA